MSEIPTVQTLHGPFTDQASMLYRRIARRHWFVAISESQRSMAPENLRWAGVVYNGIPTDRYPFRQDQDDFLVFLGRADEEKAPDLAIQAARRAGRRLVSKCRSARSSVTSAAPSPWPNFPTAFQGRGVLLRPRVVAAAAPTRRDPHGPGLTL